MATTARIEVPDKNPLKGIRDFLGHVLADDRVAGVLVPWRRSLEGPGRESLMPTLITDAKQLERVDPLAPSFPVNAAKMVARLTRGGESKAIAAVLRPCEIRAFVELVKLNQGSMDNVLVMGMDCYGAFTNMDYKVYLGDDDPDRNSLEFLRAMEQEGKPGKDMELARACLACEHPSPEEADVTLSLFGSGGGAHLSAICGTPKGEGLINRLGLIDVDSGGNGRAKALQDIVEKRTAYRDKMFEETSEATNTMEKLADYLSGCVNCYNCRVACPVCYCRECVFVTDVFDHKPWQYLDWAGKNGALRMPTDTMFYHLTRLAHMSTACVGCGQCSNACPNGVKVMELFRLVAASTQKAFDYEAGRSPDEPPPLSVFHEKEFAEVTGGLD